MMLAVTDASDSPEDQGQHGEDEGLDEANEDFQPVEWDRQQPRNQEGHDKEKNLPGKDVAEETK